MKHANIAMEIAFDGSGYHGWQSQKNALAIQDVLQAAVFKLTGETREVCGCGRTDAGVHARRYVANVLTASAIPAERFPAAMASALPRDIRVREAKYVPSDFHARFSCRKKEYVYRLYHDAFPNPFHLSYAEFHPRPLNIEAMSRAAADIVGRHDFTAFRAMGSAAGDAVRRIFSCKVRPAGEFVEIIVSADGFLYNMVRIIAGTLLYVSDGKIGQGDIPEILRSKDRTLAGKTLPPQGLYLNRVWYGRASGLAGISGI